MFDSALLYVEYLVCQNKNVFSNRSAGRHKKDKFERAGELRSDCPQAGFTHVTRLRPGHRCVLMPEGS